MPLTPENTDDNAPVAPATSDSRASEAPQAGGYKTELVKPEEVSEAAFEAALENMPPYVRSLLKIRVTLSVRLASTKLPVANIMDMGPGTIIQFKRNCEQPLSLCVGDEIVAEGEPVKVGDKFGIRISAMILPSERFYPLLSQRGIRKAS